jgi:hypothetical protein
MHHKPYRIRQDQTRPTTNSNTQCLANTYTDQPRILGSARYLGLSTYTVLLITFTFCRRGCWHLPRKFHGFKENRKKRKYVHKVFKTRLGRCNLYQST